MSCRDEIVAACGLQRDYFEMAVNRREKARECCNLVVIGMYTFLPPGRGTEVRTLEINRNWQEFSPSQSKGKNTLLIKTDGGVTLHFGDFKTAKFVGHTELSLQVKRKSVVMYCSVSILHRVKLGEMQTSFFFCYK